MQNISKPSHNPNDLAYKYPIKGLYTSRFKDGYIFNLDYKSLEVFLSSLISNETGLTQALLDGADIHTRNAAIAFDMKEDEVDQDSRFKAKAVK